MNFKDFTRTFLQGPGQGQGLFFKDKDKDFILVLKESLIQGQGLTSLFLADDDVMCYRFVFVMGTSIAMSFHAAHRRSVSKWKSFVRILRRTTILFMLGLVLSNHGNHHHRLFLGWLLPPPSDWLARNDKNVWAGPLIDCYRRLTWNNASFPAGLPGGPVVQFGGFQGHVSGCHQIGLIYSNAVSKLYCSWEHTVTNIVSAPGRLL